MEYKLNRKVYDGSIYRRQVGEAVASMVGQRFKISPDEAEDIAGLIEVDFKPREVIESLDLKSRERIPSRSV